MSRMTESLPKTSRCGRPVEQRNTEGRNYEISSDWLRIACCAWYRLVYVLRHDSAIGAGADSPTATTGYSKDQTFTERLETFSQKVKDSGPDAGNDGGGVEIVKWETIVVDIEPCERAITGPTTATTPCFIPKNQRHRSS